MSKQHTSNRGSPHKHKGMKTSLYNQQLPHQQYIHHLDSNIYTHPIYVQTISQQPNVMPYIDSQYTNQQTLVNSAQSHYVSMDRKNNHMVNTRPVIIQNGSRVSPIQANNTNLSKTKVQYTSQQNRLHTAGSAFVPPPPESFLISSSKIPEHRSPSLNRTVIVNNPTLPATNFQSVKKTYVPHHIINQIPVVYGGGNSIYEGSASQQKQNGNDQSQQVLMGYYEKLYAKYEAQCQQNAAIKKQLNQSYNQINYLTNQLKSQQPVVHNQKKKIIDRQLLHELLSQKWNKIVDQAIDRRKQSCIRQVCKVVQTSKVTIKVPGQRVEIISQGHYRS